MSDYGPYNGIVRDIHDGDTLGLDIDIGFDFPLLARNPITNGRAFTCRLFGINAPELKTKAGKKALAYLKSILPIGSKVKVISKDWDKFGRRYDGVITKSGETASINDQMVASGNAVAKTYAEELND